MNDRDYDIRLVEKTMKIDKMFEDFLEDKLGKRGQQNVAGREMGPAEDTYGYNAESAEASPDSI